MQIQCTKKLLDRMKADPAAARKAGEMTAEDDFFCWHANIITADRRKVLAFVNNSTRLTIIAYRPKPSIYKNPGEILTEGIRELFKALGIHDDITERYIQNAGHCRITATGTKSQIARMNKMADEFEAMFDGWSQFLNKKTCEIISLPDADNDYADPEDEDEELYDKIAFSDDYVRLPDKYELREKNVMYDFAESIGGNLGDRLCSALRGRHPYRYFKDTADRLGLLQEYYDFRFAAYCRFAEAWCEENGLKYHHRRKKKN